MRCSWPLLSGEVFCAVLLRVFSSLLIMLLLAGCTPPLTQVVAQATALVAGGWPGNVATPRAVTVTSDPRLITQALATATVGPGLPRSTPWSTATRAATTTPYPGGTPRSSAPPTIPPSFIWRGSGPRLEVRSQSTQRTCGSAATMSRACTTSARWSTGQGPPP